MSRPYPKAGTLLMEYPSTQAHRWEPERRPWRLTDGLRIVRRRQSYMNMLYLLMAFPLGLLYFVLFIIGFSVGTGLAFIGVGLLILLAMLGGAWWLGDFERELTMWWLGITIAPMRREQAEAPRLTFWQRTTA